MSCTVSNRQTTSVDILPINPALIAKLRAGKLYTLKNILHLSQPELQKLANVSKGEAILIIEAASRAVITGDVFSGYDKFQETDDMVKKKLCLKFLHNSFDGIYTGTITEICGKSGCGKTQFCLYLSILAQLSTTYGGLNSKVMYIHSEGEFPIKRYVEIAKKFQHRNEVCKGINLTDNLILKKVLNLKETMHVMEQSIPDLFNHGSTPKLLIIDSVAALLRCEYESAPARTAIILQFAAQIWKLANKYNIAVICVNQISGSVQKSCDIPSLGLLWSNILTTRLQISRKYSEMGTVNRVLEVVFSSYHSRVKANFMVSEKGIEIV